MNEKDTDGEHFEPLLASDAYTNRKVDAYGQKCKSPPK